MRFHGDTIIPTAMFQTQGEAKRFFVQKLIEQAASEGAPLSKAERGMLSWSETDPELTLTADQADALREELASEVSEEEYEASMAELTRRALRARCDRRSRFEGAVAAGIRQTRRGGSLSQRHPRAGARSKT